ncbi:unnamed protein product [Pylaiella littoralis]
MVRGDPVLMEQMRKMLAEQDGGAAAAAAAAARDSAIDAEIVRSTAASLEAMKEGSKSNVGRIAYNTVLAAVAGAGEHICDPAHPCNPAARCPPAPPQGAAASFTRRAERLGIRPNTYREAHVRMHNANLSIPPKEALDEGRYLWAERKTRSDATDRRVVDLATRYWHSDDISRASGDSGKILLPSKAAGEEYHPRRQLMVSGDKAYRMFLEWAPYVALKAELLEEDETFTDPGRTTFLSTRCGCLGG